MTIVEVCVVFGSIEAILGLRMSVVSSTKGTNFVRSGEICVALVHERNEQTLNNYDERSTAHEQTLERG